MRFHVLIVTALCISSSTAPVRAGALHEAARNGDLAATERLIAGGADVESKDDAGLTPLIIAALVGQREAVVLLIAQGADPQGRDGKGFTPLHAAAHAGHLGVVKYLLELGLDVDDQRNEQALAPLHLAAERDHRDVAAALLARGAAVDIKTGHGRPPIWLAVLKSHAGMVKLLRDHGAQCPTVGLAKFREYCTHAGT